MASVNVFLKQARIAAGLSQEAIAEKVGISRQAYSAIEAERAVPSTEIALKLARVLRTHVEHLFVLADEPQGTVKAEVTRSASVPPGSRVRVVEVGGRVLAKPLRGGAGTVHVLAQAEGVAVQPGNQENYVSVRLFDRTMLQSPSLVIAGCDPSASLLAPALHARGVRLVWSEEGSQAALQTLARGEAHVAGCHLWDRATGQYNLPWVERLVPVACTLVSFAVWQQGLIVAPGNPKGIRQIEDLVAGDVTIINRQVGSGSRALLDRLLAQRRIPRRAIRGYQRFVPGHLAVAEVVSAGLADVGVGVQAAATAFGLDFIPLNQERYDLVIPNAFLDELPVRVLLDELRRPSLRTQVEALGGYDAAAMGQPVN